MSTPLTITRLQTTLAALAPIDGVSVGTFGTSASVRIDFQASATTQQRTDAQSALTAFDWSDAATAAYYAALDPNRQSLIAAATNAVQNNNTFLGLGSPTQAQAVAQVQALTQQNNQIIRRLAEM